jgi:Raf kinase inhibitor-like YbhB/YbcL family protein
MKACLIIALCLLCYSAAAEETKTAILQQSSKPVFTLTSPVFANKGKIPAKYTCHGPDVNPPLTIKNLPGEAKAMALSVYDPAGIAGTWVHWVVFNIKPDKLRIGENSAPGTEALNDFGNFYYSGPCPTDDELHNYIFTVYALSEVLKDADEGDTLDTLKRAMSGKIIGEAELVGTFENPKWDKR